MTLHRELMNLEPKLSELFSTWDPPAVSPGTNGRFWGVVSEENAWGSWGQRESWLGDTFVCSFLT